MSIVEVTIAAAILLAVIGAFQIVLTNMLGSQRFMEQKNSAMYMQREIYDNLGKKDACTETFKDLNLRSLRSLEGDDDGHVAGREVPIDAIMSNDTPPTPLYQTYGASGKTYEFNTLGIDSMMLYHYKPATLSGTERYNGKAKFMVKFKKVGGNSGPELAPKGFSVNFEFKRDQANGGLVEDNGHNGQLHSCSISGSGMGATLEIAIARRFGFTMSNRGCTQALTTQDYMGDPTCVDSNNDKLCDVPNPDGYRYTKVPHPAADPDAPNNSTFVNTVITPRTPSSFGNEGRCPLSTLSKPAGTSSEDIFYIVNNGTYNGIGCRTENGWVLSSCNLVNNGLGGDADTFINTDSRGTSCYSNDWVQPHISGTPWTVENVSLITVCTRVRTADI